MVQSPHWGFSRYAPTLFEKEIFNNIIFFLSFMEKRFIFLVSLIVISLFLFSCAPQPEVVEEIPAPVVEEAPASPEVVAETAPTIETTPVVEETKPAASEYSTTGVVSM